MNLRIRDAINKPAWLARVDGLLHDAQIVERFTYDQEALTFSLRLRRKGYEYSRRRFGFLVLQYPMVPCTFSLAPVQLVSIEEGADAWKYFDELVDIDLVNSSEIALTTREARLLFHSQEPILVTLIDTGIPDETAKVFDLFTSIVPMSIVHDAVNTAEV